ncbi:glycosyltransferase [Vibrio diabolicus]|uniref:glycosyltransferase n=1 Tax=Vibrio diabolicus TaxID=50719 RepID=UPI003D7D8107
MKRIAVIGTNPNGSGGIQSFSKKLNNVIPNLSYYTLFPSSGKIVCDYAISENIIFKVINKLSLGRFFKFIMKSKLKNEKIDIAIINAPQDIYYLPDNIKNIVLVQHSTYKRWWESSKFFDKSNTLLNIVKDKCWIVSLSDFEKEIITSKMKIDDNRISVIRNPGDDVEFENKESIFNKKLVMLTRLDNKVKRIDLVIEGMKLAKNYELHIYGSGPDEKYLKEKAKGLKNVVFHSWITNVKSVFSEPVILVCSSDYEGYPMSCIEAMEASVPIIIRNTFPSVPDIIQGNGVILDKAWNGEEFARAIKEVDLNYQTYSYQAKKLSQRHSSKVIRKKWEDMILTL